MYRPTALRWHPVVSAFGQQMMWRAVLPRRGPQPHTGMRMRCTAGLHIDPNEEKVKRVAPKTVQPTPRKEQLPGPTLAATLATIVAGAPAQAQVYAPADITWGEPNEFLGTVLDRAEAQEQLHELADKAETFIAGASASPAGEQHLSAAITQRLQELRHVLPAQPHTTPQGGWPGGLSESAAEHLASIQSVADQLAAEVDKHWALPLPAAQAATYAAAVIGIVLIAQVANKEPTAAANTSDVAQRTSNGSSTGGDSTASKDSAGSWGAPRRTPSPERRSGRSGTPKAARGAGSSVPQSRPAFAATGATAGANPVQEAWQQFRTSPPEYRQVTPQPARPTATESSGARVRGRTATTSAATWGQQENNSTSTSSSSRGPGQSAKDSKSRSASPAAMRGLSMPTVVAIEETAHEEEQLIAEAKREALKEKLKLISVSLGPLLSVVPGGDSARGYADLMLHELESLAPDSTPLAPQGLRPDPDRPSVWGKWQLVYATNEPAPAPHHHHNHHHHHHHHHTHHSHPIHHQGGQQPGAAAPHVVPVPPPAPDAAPAPARQPGFIERWAQQQLASLPKTGPTHRPIGKPNPWANKPATTNDTDQTDDVFVATVNTGSASTNSPNASPANNLSAGSEQSGTWQHATGVAEQSQHLQTHAGAPRQSNLGSDLVSAALHLAAVLPGFGLVRVEQELWQEPDRPDVMTVSNSAVFSLGLLGEWRVGATGCWQQTGDGHSALGWFEVLSLQPHRVWGMDATSLPEVVVTLPDALRTQSIWDVTYLDSQVRVTRAGDGVLFLFQRATEADEVSDGTRSDAAQWSSWTVSSGAPGFAGAV